jgi:two-component system phosphate regulon response regulator PhoB/two-component system alkaline phosphatase synthesis response regulator PhoP
MGKILIVEDDKFLRDLLSRKLEEEKFDITTAVDGEEGIKKIQEERPDLVLLDLILPGINGFDVLKRMKEDPATADILVIVLSNLGQKEDVDRAITLGANDFLVKAHFTLDEITQRVRKYIPEESNN